MRASSGTPRRFEVPLYACSVAASNCGPIGGASLLRYVPAGPNVVFDTIDANGRARALVRLGAVAGEASVIVTVAALGVRDSVPFTVTARAVGGVRAATHDVGYVPADTVVALGVYVFTVAAGQDVAADAADMSPAWSPSCDRIAYLVCDPSYYDPSNGTLTVVNPDGRRHFAVPGSRTFSPGVGWSPNGAHLIGRSGLLRVVRVRDGADAPLELPC